MEYNKAFDFFEQTLLTLHKCIVPIYKMSHLNNRPEFVGSSVYCRFGPVLMLFSAGHVFKEILNERPWYPYSMTEMRDLPCEEYDFPNEEPHDIGIAVLRDNLPMWSPFASEKFSTFKQNDVYQHLLVGYPGSSTKRSTGDTQKIEIKGYLTSASPTTEYARLKVNPSKEFIVQFRKESVFGKNRNTLTFPNPNGMSGGGVFQFHEESPRSISLVGIMTHWDINKRNAIIATRIETITNLFRVFQPKIE